MNEFKRFYRLILALMLLTLPTAVQLEYGIEHRNQFVLYVMGVSVALNMWIYVKWWILEGKE